MCPVSVRFRGIDVTVLYDIPLCFVYLVYLFAFYVCILLHSITACVYVYVCTCMFMQVINI